jgi:glycosyltransferase involved in cell wall biosynthesis
MIALREAFDVVLNFSDIPIRTKVRQIFLFDWPYAAHPESIAWLRSRFSERIFRKVKLWYFEKNLQFIGTCVVQTKTIGDRLKTIYGIDNLALVPNAVDKQSLVANSVSNFNFGGSRKLLCFSRYYSHKNIEVLLDVAELIRAEAADFKIVLTIEPSQGAGARALLREVEERGLGGVVLNIGAVGSRDIPALYASVDGLLLPTLLESFSGTYVEAMFFRVPIFTSDLPFARDACGDCAFYFDPAIPADIFQCISRAFSDEDEIARKVAIASRRLALAPTWKDNFREFVRLIDRG